MFQHKPTPRSLNLCAIILIIVAVQANTRAVHSEEIAEAVATDLKMGEATPLAPSSHGLLIDSVIVITQNVFDSSQTSRWWIYRALNRLHITTRRSIVEREITQKAGERYDTTSAYETERLLRALPFIFDAEVSLLSGAGEDSLADLDADSAKKPIVANILQVRTIDKWSLAGGFQVARRGGRNLYEVGVEESNLLGLGHRFELAYNISQVDPNYVTFEYSNPRFPGLPGSLELKHSSNPLDRNVALLGKFGLIKRADQIGARIFVNRFKTRRLRVLDSDTLPVYFESAESFSIQGSYRIGGYNTKLTLSPTYAYLNQRVENRAPLDPTQEFSFPQDSLVHRFSQTIDLRDTRFVRTRAINYLGRTEDLELSKGVSLRYSQARGRGFSGLLYHALTVNAILDHRFSNLIAESYYSRTGWFKSGREFSSQTDAALRLFFTGARSLTAAARLAYRFQSISDGFDPLSLDESSGVRGYPINHRSGDRYLTGGIELRTRNLLDILSTRIGLAFFADGGAAWRRGASFSSAEKLWSIGPGLRLDLAQGGGGRIIRVDFAYAGTIKAWQISSGVQQYFDALFP